MKNNDKKNRLGSFTPLVLLAVAAISLVGFAVYFINSNVSDSLSISPVLTTVERGEFFAQVLDQGEIQSSENEEVRCEARARNGGLLTVIEVVPEGTRVKGGDFLVRLDSNSFEVELESQKIFVANAQTAVIQAEAELTTAIETLKEYEQGIFVEKTKLIENDIYDSQSLIETSKQELTLAKAILEHSKKLQGKGFITSQQLEGDGFEVKRAEFALKTAENKWELAKQQLDVLNRITRVKESVQLKSNIEAAKVKMANQRESLLVEESKLGEIKEQIKKCEIRVPPRVEGQVVYAQESSRGGSDWILEEGTSVRERQVLIRVPNPNRMEVKALINEQSITQIRKGMPVSINVDALTNQTLSGLVTKVNQYAESSGWMSSSIRKYAVLVEIIDPPEMLKPGMNASVSIEVRYEPDAIKAPIQTVYAVQDRHFCLVQSGEQQWETREVQIDADNSQVVLIRSGVKPGEQLVMNPGKYKDLMDLPELELDKKIQISEEMKTKMAALQKKPVVAVAQNSADIQAPAPAGPGAADVNNGGPNAGGSGPGNGRPSFDMPANGLALIKSKDTDNDGKLSKDEVGQPYSFFFDRIDTDQDGFLSQQEADKSIQQMKQRMQGGGREGGPRL